MMPGRDALASVAAGLEEDAREQRAELLEASTAPYGSSLPIVARVQRSTDTAFHDLMAKAIARRGLSEKALCAPGMDIIAPAVEALRFASARQEIANFMVSAMDPRIGHSVLPAYLDVLKQMTRDELNMLRNMPAFGISWVTSDLVYVNPVGPVIVAYRNIVPGPLAAACERRSNIPQYMDNLVRLNLIYDRGEQAADDAGGRMTARVPFVRELINRRPSPSKAGLRTRSLAITDFGDRFRRTCLD